MANNDNNDSKGPKAERRLDALGVVAYAVYMVIGGIFVFGFGRSLSLAVQTQNETPCRSLMPYHTKVIGQVLDSSAKPATTAQVIPVIGGRSGVPIAVDSTEARFSLFMPKGAQSFRIQVPNTPEFEAPVVLGASEVLELELTVDAQRESGGTVVERSRTTFDAPDFTLEDLEGNPVSLSELKGQLVVLNFWATWCEPCVSEWPQIAKLAERITQGDDVTVIAVSIDGDKADIQPFLEQMSLADSNVRVLWDSSTKLHERFGSSKIPDTFVVNEQGVVSKIFVNVREWGSPDALHCIESSVGS